MGWERLDGRVHVRRIRADGTVVDELLTSESLRVDGGKVVSLVPPLVELRTGETVTVDAILDTGVTVAVGDVVLVVMRGGFVLAAKVRLV